MSALRHGYSAGPQKTRIYRIWRGMVGRCHNPNREAFKDYGGRGITVCERWKGEFGFDNFLADMGEPALGMTLDRNDNNGDYCPENCTWVPKGDQSKNRRYNWRVSINGQEMTAAEATNILGISGSDTIANMLRKRGFKKTECVPLESLINRRHKTHVPLYEVLR